MRLSILIPARQEEFLKRTIDDVFTHTTDDTEVLVALDNWENPPQIEPRTNLTIIKTTLGQRGATNKLAELSTGKYVMKLDAHCSLSHGFDTKMLKIIEDDMVLVPTLHNLWAYDWVCPQKHRHFQGKYDKCEVCGSTELTKDVVWNIIPKPSKVSYYFDTNLHFQYCEKQSEEWFPETMSIQGSCFMVSRKKYFELNLCDENFGSWGQQGTEVACKMWLSGGQVRSTRKAFYGHQFRETEGFPYLNPTDKILATQKHSRELFLQNRWDKQKRSIQWLIEKFDYQGDWSKERVAELCSPFDNN